MAHPATIREMTATDVVPAADLIGTPLESEAGVAALEPDGWRHVYRGQFNMAVG